jgi:hypothetical protein
VQTIAIHTFHNVTSGESDGNVFRNDKEATTLNLTFIATSTFVANFEVLGEGDNTNWKPIMACNLGTLELATTATNDDYIYQIDITGIHSVRIRLSANAGTVTCIGKVVG